MRVTVALVMMVMPRLASSRVSVVLARRSHAESTQFLRMMSVTLHPAEFHMEANSTATAPAPMMVADVGKSRCRA